MLCHPACGTDGDHDEDADAVHRHAVCRSNGSGKCTRHHSPRQPNVPIASSVLVPEGAELLFVSGMAADVADTDAPAGSVERLGDTATQAKSVLDKIVKELAASGFTMADVVKMNVYLVGDPRKGGTMDFAGLMKAYLQTYGMRALEKNLPHARPCRWRGFRSPVRWLKSRSSPRVTRRTDLRFLRQTAWRQVAFPPAREVRIHFGGVRIAGERPDGIQHVLAMSHPPSSSPRSDPSPRRAPVRTGSWQRGSGPRPAGKARVGSGPR